VVEVCSCLCCLLLAAHHDYVHLHSSTCVFVCEYGDLIFPGTILRRADVNKRKRIVRQLWSRTNKKCSALPVLFSFLFFLKSPVMLFLCLPMVATPRSGCDAGRPCDEWQA